MIPIHIYQQLGDLTSQRLDLVERTNSLGIFFLLPNQAHYTNLINGEMKKLRQNASGTVCLRSVSCKNQPFVFMENMYPKIYCKCLIDKPLSGNVIFLFITMKFNQTATDCAQLYLIIPYIVRCCISHKRQRLYQILLKYCHLHGFSNKLSWKKLFPRQKYVDFVCFRVNFLELGFLK